MPTHPTIELLKTRRSVKPDLLVAPAPSAEELETILSIAARVPDHKKLAPWRFVIIDGAAREKLGALAAEACQREEAEPPSHVRLDTERKRFMRAPLVIAVVSRVKETRGAPRMGADPIGRGGLHELVHRRQRAGLRVDVDHGMDIVFEDVHRRLRIGRKRTHRRLRAYRYS